MKVILETRSYVTELQYIIYSINNNLNILLFFSIANMLLICDFLSNCYRELV